jgi:hypothetical protein
LTSKALNLRGSGFSRLKVMQLDGSGRTRPKMALRSSAGNVRSVGVGLDDIVVC